MNSCWIHVTLGYKTPHESSARPRYFSFLLCNNLFSSFLSLSVSALPWAVWAQELEQCFTQNQPFLQQHFSSSAMWGVHTGAVVVLPRPGGVYLVSVVGCRHTNNHTLVETTLNLNCTTSHWESVNSNFCLRQPDIAVPSWIQGHISSIMLSLMVDGFCVNFIFKKTNWVFWFFFWSKAEHYLVSIISGEGVALWSWIQAGPGAAAGCWGCVGCVQGRISVSVPTRAVCPQQGTQQHLHRDLQHQTTPGEQREQSLSQSKAAEAGSHHAWLCQMFESFTYSLYSHK